MFDGPTSHVQPWQERALSTEANTQTDYPGLPGQLPVSMMSNGRTGVVKDAGKQFTSEKNGLFAASQPGLAESAPLKQTSPRGPRKCQFWTSRFIHAARSGDAESPLMMLDRDQRWSTEVHGKYFK